MYKKILVPTDGSEAAEEEIKKNLEAIGYGI